MFKKIKAILELFCLYLKLRNRYEFLYFSIEDTYVTLDLKKKYSYFESTWLEAFYYYTGSKSFLLSMNKTGKMYDIIDNKVVYFDIGNYYKVSDKK